jgi:hypothetical protein
VNCVAEHQHLQREREREREIDRERETETERETERERRIKEDYFHISAFLELQILLHITMFTTSFLLQDNRNTAGIVT